MRKFMLAPIIVAATLILGIGIAQAQTVTLFGTKMPKNTADTDTSAVTLGVKFKSAQAGTISAVRFYRAVKNTTGYTVKLFNGSGSMLASARVTSDICAVPCWEQISFASPISISPNIIYVAAYYTSNGRYPNDTGTNGGLTNAVTNGPLTAPASSTVGGNGVYTYSTGFPNQTWQSSNYYVDVVFAPSAPALQMVFSPPNPSIPARAAPGTTVATVMVTWSDCSPFTGTLNLNQAPYADDSHTFALSGNNVIINPSGSGVGSDGGTTQSITVQAVQ
jgi:hypothetical protein